MKKWKDLSLKKQQAWLSSGKPNGCGAKGGWIKPPLASFFKASCNIHDWSYAKGKNEKDRKQADDGFLKYMLIDIQREENNLKRVHYVIWAYLYYIALRIFGRKAFYRNK